MESSREVEGFRLQPPDLNLAAGSVWPGNEDASQPVRLTRQVASRSTLVGYSVMPGLRGAPRHHAPRSAFGPDERSIPRFRQELVFHQHPQELLAGRAIEAPEPLGLGWRQSKSRH